MPGSGGIARKKRERDQNKDVVAFGAVLREIERGVLENSNEITELFNFLRSIAEFIRVIEIRKITASETGIGINKRLDNLSVDEVANIAVSFECNHVLKTRTLWNDNQRCKPVKIFIFIRDAFNETEPPPTRKRNLRRIEGTGLLWELVRRLLPEHIRH